MKIWNYRTFKGRRFYRLNHADLAKSMFFLSYYRILHTAYLKRQRYCITAVKKMFMESFGAEPDAWSISYISDTEKCFVNDTITEALNKDGKILCPQCLLQMLIEIGFDVYLIKTASEDKKPDKKEFYQWLPMKKDRTLKKAVKCFWKERLPKEKLLFNLYYQLEPYKHEILATYRKILLANDTLLIHATEKDNVLAYIDENMAVRMSINETEPDIIMMQTTPVEARNIYVEEENSESADNDEIESVIREVSEEITIPVFQPSEETVEAVQDESDVQKTQDEAVEVQLALDEPALLQNEAAQIGLIDSKEPEKQTIELFVDEEEVLTIIRTEELQPTFETEKVTQQPVVAEDKSRKSIVQNTGAHSAKIQKSKMPQAPEGRGFNEKNKMTRKKAVTCAVCVAAAGALLVPLVAYTVMKHKAA